MEYQTDIDVMALAVGGNGDWRHRMARYLDLTLVTLVGIGEAWSAGLV